jgi:hypothetical protein
MDVSLAKTIRELIHTKAELHQRYLELHCKFYSEFHDFLDFQAQVNECVTRVYQQPSQQQWILKLLRHYRDQIQVESIERAAFITENTIDRLLDAAVEGALDWLTDESYLADIESMIITCLNINSENG